MNKDRDKDHQIPENTETSGDDRGDESEMVQVPVDTHVVSDASENQSKEVQKTCNTELIVECQDHDKRVLVAVNIKSISDHDGDKDREDQILTLKERNSHTEDLEERTQMPVSTEVVLDQDAGHHEDKCDQILLDTKEEHHRSENAEISSENSGEEVNVAVNIKAGIDNGEGQDEEAHIPVNIKANSDYGEGQGRASMDTKISGYYGSQIPPNVIWLRL